MMRRPCLLFLSLLFSCTGKPNPEAIHINLINNNRSVQFSGLNYAVVQDIQRDTNVNWQSLFPVYKMPADTDLKDYQPIQPGLYQVKNGSVVFTPDTPFKKDQRYFVRYFRYSAGSSITDFAKGKNKPGSIHYTDLIFKL